MSSVIHIFHHKRIYYEGYQLKEDKMGGEWGIQGNVRNEYNILF
jgi:hypothetical protein